MNERLYTIAEKNLLDLNDATKKIALTSLESGNVLYFPTYSFALTPNEHQLLSESVLAPKEKNISYDHSSQQLSSFNVSTNITPTLVHQFMQRYAEFAKQLVSIVIPQYSNDLHWGRTSFRPAQIKDRQISKRNDDTRLHVDAFPSTAVYDRRILRVFCNINPHGEPRVWHIGEPFEKVLASFSPNIPTYSAYRAKLLKMVRGTRNLRSPYDHYMLKLHNSMKLDDNYQQTVPKHRVDFPSQSTWFVFTDHVSHAALSGQFLLEQTFYLPVDAMENQSLSPLRQWEKLKACTLLIE